MPQLTNDSLDFAREHLTKFYLSDFFPDPIELDAVWSQWTEVKTKLMSIDIKEEYEPHGLSSQPWRKPKGGYRIVHQLEVTDCLVYTALAYLVANQIESNRKPIEAGIACAYRIHLSDGSFFGNGNGFDKFKERSRLLSEKYQFVLTTDIVDFYNQIYLHRLQNAIASAGANIADIATDIERFLSKLNLRNSQGVPVGPATSIVLSEATLSDVDDFLSDLEVEHTRYVDDFRIFSNDKIHLDKVHRELTLYLHKAHRLTLSGEKTRVQTSEAFVQSELDNHYELEKAELFDSLDEANDYVPATPYEGESDKPTLDEWGEPLTDEVLQRLSFEQHKLRVIEGFTALCERPILDLGMARVLLRQARMLKIREIADRCFDNLEFLKPAFNAVAFFIRDITPKSDKGKICEQLLFAFSNSNLSDLERVWLEWLILSTKLYEQNGQIKQLLLKSSNITHQAILAFNENNLAWVRKYKDEIFALSPKGRRAVIYASRILPEDERTPWLKQLKRSSSDITELALINWSLNWKDVEEDFFSAFDDDIPF